MMRGGTKYSLNIIIYKQATLILTVIGGVKVAWTDTKIFWLTRPDHIK